MIYLDHNATTPLLPEVVEGMLPYLREHFGNPSSSHAYGRAARDAIECARAQVAELIGCDAPDEIIFTSGGTESNNLAIRGSTPTRIITSVIEHPATTGPCLFLRDHHRCSVERIAVDRAGQVDIAELSAHLSSSSSSTETTLVTVMHANNETGVLQPIAEVARQAHTRGALIHTDAAQSVGKVPVRVREIDVDLLTIAGHKLNAPKGIGALYVRRGLALRPLVLGGGHEHGLRPGTENVASIVGLGIACSLAQERLATNKPDGAKRRRAVTRRLRRGMFDTDGKNKPSGVLAVREHLWKELQAAIPGIVVHGHPTDRLPNTLNVRFPGVRSGNDVLANTPEVAASTGSACHEGQTETASAVLLAMGISNEDALRAVRLSIGVTTTMRDVERAVTALKQGWMLAAQRT